MDSNSTPPGGSSGQPESGSTSASSGGNTPSTSWTPPAYPPSGGASPGSAPPTPPAGYDMSGTPARVDQPSYGPPPGQQYTPPPGYPQQPPQGAPTQPYGPPPQGYPQQPGQYQQPGYQQPGYQQQYAQPPQGYPPAGYQQPYAQPAPVAAKKSGVPTFVWVLGGIVVFIIACSAVAYFTVFAAFNSAGNAIKNVVNTAGAAVSAETFETDLKNGDYQDAYSYLGGDLAKNYSAAKLQQRWEALAGTDSSFSINTRFGAPRDVGNNRTEIDWIVTPPNKSSVTIQLTMDEGTKDWKIIDAKPDLIPNP